MVKVSFFTEDELICGFELCGHSGAGRAGRDIVCASVSSAAYMTANTITDVIGAKANAEASDGYMKLMLTDDLSQAQQILKGFRLHIESLAADYPKNIKVISRRRCQNA